MAFIVWRTGEWPSTETISIKLTMWQQWEKKYQVDKQERKSKRRTQWDASECAYCSPSGKSSHASFFMKYSNKMKQNEIKTTNSTNKNVRSVFVCLEGKARCQTIVRELPDGNSCDKTGGKNVNCVVKKLVFAFWWKRHTNASVCERNVLTLQFKFCIRLMWLLARTHTHFVFVCMSVCTLYNRVK